MRMSNLNKYGYETKKSKVLILHIDPYGRLLHPCGSLTFSKKDIKQGKVSLELLEKKLWELGEALSRLLASDPKMTKKVLLP